MSTTTHRHAVGRCDNCGFGIAVEGRNTTTCNNCKETVVLKWVIGTHNERIPCDTRCMYAVRNDCSCSCGGANHGAGYINVEMVPKWIRERDAKAFLDAQKRREAKEERERRRREAKEERERRRREEAISRILEAHPLLQALRTGEFRGESRFLDDMAIALERGSMTTNQIAAAERCILAARQRRDNEQRWEQERQQALAAGVRCPTGKLTFTGQIIKRRIDSNPYGYGTIHKVLVATSDGWKVWGTLPGTLTSRTDEELRALTLTLTAEVQPSKEDPLFGFMKRPRLQTVS